MADKFNNSCISLDNEGSKQKQDTSALDFETLQEIQKATDHFKELLIGQAKRHQKIKGEKTTDENGENKHQSLEKGSNVKGNKSDHEKVVIGVCGGDGIGPIITGSTGQVLQHLLRTRLEKGSVEIRNIDGLTIDNRMAQNAPVPDDVLAEIKECTVLLKGPTTTPKGGTMGSANVTLRRELDLYANVRPVKVEEEGIDWIFFRENTEGEYVLGNDGISIGNQVAVDFKVITHEGTRRIAVAAFEHARKTGKKKVSIVTKANVIKTTDGMFSQICHKVAEDYPEIEVDEWYVDIVTAKLLDAKRRSEFSVFVLPNLYGDIVTDEAAELQGGVGTAGSANIGSRYAMFEAIHGSAPRMIERGYGQYANPASMLKASEMMLEHLGFKEELEILQTALDITLNKEKRLVVTGRETGATCQEFTDYVIETISKLQSQ